MDDRDREIRPFAASDQAAARTLILAGLGEHFGWIDETVNPDLDDIQAAYAAPGHHFVVAEIGGELAGTGALVDEGPGVGRLVRMSVSPRHRRRGLGRALVAHLVGEARRRGHTRLLVETNDDWDDAIALYRSCGFAVERRAGGEVHLALDLRSRPPAPPAASSPSPDARDGTGRGRPTAGVSNREDGSA
jgi:ribosomal protein S18 acetylase RimI-like enzyme